MRRKRGCSRTHRVEPNDHVTVAARWLANSLEHFISSRKSLGGALYIKYELRARGAPS